MKLNFKKYLNKRPAVLNRFRKGVSTRDAIGISIILHLLVGTTIASFFVSTLYIQPPDSTTIEFDLSTEKAHAAKQFNGKLAEKYGVTNSEASKENGRASNPVQGNMNRDAVVMASLASLSSLKESFNFIMQNVSADSLGGFSPIDGNVPGSEYDSFGYKIGEGLGSGDGTGIYGGGGYCAPSPLPNPGK